MQGQTFQWGISGGVTSGSFLGEAHALRYRAVDGGLSAQFVGRRRGFAFGVNLRTELTRRFAARTGLSYVQQGGVVERRRPAGLADGFVNETAVFQLDYLTIPLLAEAHLPQRTVLGLRPSLYTGPELGLNPWGRSTRTNRTAQGQPNYYRGGAPVMVSVVAGAELAYPFPSGGEVALYLRYHHGLTDVTGAQGSDARLGTIQAGLLIRYAQ